MEHRILELKVPRADESTVAGVEAVVVALQSIGFEASYEKEDGTFKVRLSIGGMVLDEH